MGPQYTKLRKLAPDKLNRQERLLKQAKVSKLNPPETKDRRSFKYWGELVEKYWRTLGGKLVYVSSSSVFVNI